MSCAYILSCCITTLLIQLSEEVVPPWGFYAPDKHSRDVSAATVGSFGMLKIYAYTKKEYLDNALKFVNN